jgi:hypothetical protein
MPVAPAEHPPVPQMGQQAGQAVVGWYRQSQHGRACARQQPGVRDPRQIEKGDAIGIRRRKLAGDRNSDRGLADATRPDQRDEPSLRKFRGQGRDGDFPADHTGERRRQLVDRRCRSRRWQHLLAEHVQRRHKAIAAACVGDDVAVAVLAIAQCPPQQSDIDTQICLVNERVGPDARDQRFFAHQLAGALHQRNQDLHRAVAECNLRILFAQQLLGWIQLEWPKTDRAARSRDSIFGHDAIPPDGPNASGG